MASLTYFPAPLCWWCTEVVEIDPVGLPKFYSVSVGKMGTEGDFCSFACAHAYGEVHGMSKSLLRQHYMQMTNATFSEAMPKAPHFNRLRKFGGPLSIAEFRSYGTGPGAPIIERFTYPSRPAGDLLVKRVKVDRQAVVRANDQLQVQVEKDRVVKAPVRKTLAQFIRPIAPSKKRDV